jgi:hypothetical protein
MRVELWSVDEYGQGNIIKSAKDVETIFTEARKYVSSLNLDNALSADEKTKNWDAYFPIIVTGKQSVVSRDMLYAGNRRNGKHECYVKDKKGNYGLAELSKEAVVRHFLGDVPVGRSKEKKTETWVLKDHKGNVIEGLSSPELHAKTQLFFKILP